MYVVLLLIFFDRLICGINGFDCRWILSHYGSIVNPGLPLGVGFAITPNLFTSGWRVGSSYTCVGKRFSLHRSWWFYSVDTLLILLVPSSSQILVLVPVTVRHTARPGGLPGLPLAINMNNNPGHLLSSKGNCRSNFWQILAEWTREDGGTMCVYVISISQGGQKEPLNATRRVRGRCVLSTKKEFWLGLSFSATFALHIQMEFR